MSAATTPAVATGTLRATEISMLRRICVEPEALTVTEWAERYRMLPETSTSPGPYRASVCPYHRRWQDLLAEPETTLVALCWAAQTGKSTVLENAIGYRIHRMPAPMLIVQPKQEMAEAWAKERFVPMVVATPVLRERVRLARSSDSTLRYKRFPGGFLYAPSAQSASELAARSASYVMCDEVDRYQPIPGEGNPVEIVGRRQGAADIGCLVLTSTPRDAETTVIWPYLEGGTDERYLLPCPHCDHMQELRWGGPDKPFGLKWAYGKPRGAEYLCEACAAVISEREKPGMLAAGDWRATRPENPYPSSHLSALYSPFAKSGWGVIAEEWERAQGKPGDLQVFVNTRLSELWAEASQKLDSSILTDRLDESLEEGVVPEGAAVVTVGADVQDNRVEVYWWAWGASLASWLVKFQMFEGDPARDPKHPDSVWRRVDEAIFTPLVHVSGQRVPVSASLIDSGFQTTAVYRYTDSRKTKRLYACKGVGGKLPVLGRPSTQTKARVIVFPVGVDTAKDEFLRSQILESRGAPAYVHLPAWLTADQCEQLVSEKRVRKIFKGVVSYEWRPKKDGQATEALDCRIYARAAVELLGARVVANFGKIAERLSVKPEGPTDTGGESGETEDEVTRNAPTPQRPRGSWATRWKR